MAKAEQKVREILGIDEEHEPGNVHDHHKFLAPNRAVVGNPLNVDDVSQWVQDVFINAKTAALTVESHRQEFPDIEVPARLTSSITMLEFAATLLDPKVDEEGRVIGPAQPLFAYIITGAQLSFRLDGIVIEAPNEQP